MGEKRIAGGRPRKHPPDAKRPTMAFRMSSSLHEKLKNSAVVSERSLSEEIEQILEAHFAGHDQRVVLRKIVVEALAQHEAAAPERMALRLGRSLSDLGPGTVGGQSDLYAPRPEVIGSSGQKPFPTALIGTSASQQPSQIFDGSALNRPLRTA